MRYYSAFILALLLLLDPAAGNSVEQEWRAGVFDFGRSALDAPFADDQRRPLIVLSHGTGGSAAQLSWLAEQLVNAGYVVAAVNHHGNTATEETSWPQGFVLPGERTRDLTLLIDRLAADHELSTHIDFERVGAAGFSLGGFSVLAAIGARLTLEERQSRCERDAGNPICSLPPEADFSMTEIDSLAISDSAFRAAIRRDSEPISDARIRAVYAIAPALVSLMEGQDLSSVSVPVRIALAEDDQQISFARTLEVTKDYMPTATVLTIPGAVHYTFLAPCSFRGRVVMRGLCSDASQVDRVEVHDRVGRDATEFFDARLRP